MLFATNTGFVMLRNPSCLAASQQTIWRNGRIGQSGQPSVTEALNEKQMSWVQLPKEYISIIQ